MTVQSKEQEMRKSALAVCLLLLGTNAALAQGKTRAQVYQELIEAKRNGLDFVTDASYPAVATINQTVVAQMKSQRAYAQQGNEADHPR
jgi:Domain of unknown function (DUF4148)